MVTKLAVIGGGMSSLSSVFHITSRPNWQKTIRSLSTKWVGGLVVKALAVAIRTIPIAMKSTDFTYSSASITILSK